MNESISLEYRDGSSDKVYQAHLEQVQGTGDFTVKFSYGRRGSALTSGTKTPQPTPYYLAKKIYDKLVNEKVAKGYQVAGKSSASPVMIATRKSTGIIPQLLNEIGEEDVQKYIDDPAWGMQEKNDGQRKTMTSRSGDITIGNKKGLETSIDPIVHTDFVKLLKKHPDVSIDGEDMGNHIRVFDLLTSAGGYQDRYLDLMNMKLPKSIVLVQLAITKKQKEAMFKRLKNDKAEGVVFKKLDAIYKPGRPNSGGDQLKFKFKDTASCIVLANNAGKSSIAVGVLDEKGEIVNVGNSTVYANQNVPNVGDIVEIEYLYYFPGGSLFQPVLKGIRVDVDREECLLSKLKTKQTIEAE